MCPGLINFRTISYEVDQAGLISAHRFVCEERAIVLVAARQWVEGVGQVYAAARALEDQIEYDENDQPILREQKEVEPLPPMDHSKVTYDDFRKFFYKEAPEVKAMGANELMILQKQLEVKVSGFDCPNPVSEPAAPLQAAE